MRNIWNKIKNRLAKFSLVWRFMLISITLVGFTSFTSDKPTHTESSSNYSEGSVWITEWLSSDNASSAYGKGRFFYRISRSSYPVDKYGNHKYDIYFISDSYYAAPYYDQNGNGVIDQGEPYRSATKIDAVNLYVGNSLWNNSLTGTHTFWILFQGNYDAGVGDICISFYAPANVPVSIRWSAPKPY